jgi:exodeoxyribonuclease VII large subunit
MEVRLNSVIGRRLFAEPHELVNRRELILGDIESRMTASMKNSVSVKRRAFMAVQNIKLLTEKNISAKTHRFRIAVQSLDNLSPLNVMKRGYAVAVNGGGKIIRRVDDAEENFLLHVTDGSISCIVESINKGDIIGQKEDINIL